jgi:peptidyl-prolyl cis-trans isomerase C
MVFVQLLRSPVRVLVLCAGLAGWWMSAGLAVLPAQTKSKAAVMPAAAGVLVRVEGQPITEEDLERLARSLRIDLEKVPEAERASMRQAFLDRLIDMRLVQKFLAGRKIEADPKELADQVAFIQKMVKKEGDTAQGLAAVGFTEKSLRDELSLQLAWKAYVTRAVTDQQIRDYFEAHRQEFDGTQVRASHIFIKVQGPAGEAEAEHEQARRKLEPIRAEIVAGKTTFAEAAAQHSEAPSREQGGDVGFFTWQGKMPEAFSRVAFALKPGELSKPFSTPFGAHLCLVTDRKPGELSLEDARSDVVRRMSEELWTKTVAQLRNQAKIERPAATK